MTNRLKLSDPFNYENDYNYSLNDNVSFWDDVSTKYIKWDKKYIKVYSGDEIYPDWFDGGMLNTCYNVLDKNSLEPLKKHQIALIYECPFINNTIKVTYGELYERVCEFSRVLLNLNIGCNDRVLIHLPVTIEGIISMLSCSRIGATYCNISECSNIVLVDRLNSITPKLVITSNYIISNDKIIPFSPNLIKALESSTHKLLNIITLNRKGFNGINKQQLELISNIPIISNSLDWDNEIKKSKLNPYYEYVSVESNHPLLIIYSSGTTGESKPYVKSNATHLLYNEYYWDILSSTFEKPYCYFFISLMEFASFQTMFYSILSSGNTLVIFEGGTSNKNYAINKFWEIIEKHKVNYFKIVPSLMKIVIKSDPDANIKNRYNLSSLKAICIGSDYIEDTLINYIEDKLKLDAFLNYGQTEIGLFLMTSINTTDKSINVPNELKVYCRPPPSIFPIIISKDGSECKLNETGSLLFKLPMAPGFATTIYNNSNKFNQLFSNYKGYYTSGDLAIKNENGSYLVVSRVDDIIRIGLKFYELNKIEQSILKHQDILDCCCITINDIKSKKQEPLCLIVLKENIKIDKSTLQYQLNLLISNDFGSNIILKKIIIVNHIPKSKMGKIPRNVLSNIYNDPNYKPPNSFENIDILNELIKAFKN